MSREDRAIFVKQNADKKEFEIFTKSLDQGDYIALNESFVQKWQKIKSIKDEAKRVAAEYADKLKPMEKELLERGEVLKTKSIQVEEEVYSLINFNSMMMEKFNGDGDFMGSRPLTVDERQTNILDSANIMSISETPQTTIVSAGFGDEVLKFGTK